MYPSGQTDMMNICNGGCLRKDPTWSEDFLEWWFQFTCRFNSPIWRFLTKHRIGKFESFIFPVIKNMSTEFTTKDFVSVQPMTELPPGTVFYMDFVYAGGKRKRWYQFWKWL
jgi:hypothetical protein